MRDLLKELETLGNMSEAEETEKMIYLQSRMAALLRYFMKEHPDFTEKETLRIITTGKVKDLYLDEKLAEAFSANKSDIDGVHFAAVAAAYCYGLVGIAQKNQIHWSFACKMLDIIFTHEEQYRRLYPEYMRLAVLLAYMLDYLSWTEGFLLDRTWSKGESFSFQEYLLA